MFHFRVLCDLQFVFEFIVPALDASFSSSFVLRFRVHFSCFRCFVFELIFAVLGTSFSRSLFLFCVLRLEFWEPAFCFRALDEQNSKTQHQGKHAN